MKRNEKKRGRGGISASFHPYEQSVNKNKIAADKKETAIDISSGHPLIASHISRSRQKETAIDISSGHPLIASHISRKVRGDESKSAGTRRHGDASPASCLPSFVQLFLLNES
ncbi:hypothetical protein CEXT_252421 [Caerostris extrusa]|uniref:Uncharacterized protein n=1 Tax=Caerostris extrusa TaxID=172846 RepID=A0AAV4SDP1_CAEEX|nr:hypothetical protein CEXT_252421 [Caerostris extrusa]